MFRIFKILVILSVVIFCMGQADAGIISRAKNWFNTSWDDYGNYSPPSYGTRTYSQGTPRRPIIRRGGTITGFTPSITPYNGYYPSVGNYHSPIITPQDRFNHLPYGVPQINTPPTRMITDFNTNVGTKTGVTILD